MISVTPDTFTKVMFDVAEIRDAAKRAAELVRGFDDSRSFELAVDEERMTTRIRISSLTPLVLGIDSGALEEAKRPRTLSQGRTTSTVARLLAEVADREFSDFGAPELGEPSDLSIRVAWDVYCYGRISRLGLSVQKAALRYNFRNRVGFSDTADAAFDRLWNADSLTYADIVSLAGHT